MKGTAVKHPLALKQFSEAMVFDDGERVGFRVERDDGEALDVTCSLAEIGDIFFFLGSLARDAGEARYVAPPAAGDAHNYLTAIPAQGIGFQSGPGPNETMIVMRLTGFDVTFAVPSRGLAGMADELGRVARTLSADQAKKN
jgi:hypothetical protein